MCAAIVWTNIIHTFHSMSSCCVATCTWFVPQLLIMNFYFVVYDVIITNEVRALMMLWETMNQTGVAYNVDSTD